MKLLHQQGQEYYQWNSPCQNICSVNTCIIDYIYDNLDMTSYCISQWNLAVMNGCLTETRIISKHLKCNIHSYLKQDSPPLILNQRSACMLFYMVLQYTCSVKNQDEFAMPVTCENWFSFINSSIYDAHQTCEIYQVTQNISKLCGIRPCLVNVVLCGINYL